MLLRRNRDVRMEERQGLTRYPRPSPTQLPSCPNFKFFFTVPIFTAVCSHKCFSLVFICLLKFQDPWQYLIGADLFCFCFFLFFPLFHTVIGLKKTHTCLVHPLHLTFHSFSQAGPTLHIISVPSYLPYTVALAVRWTWVNPTLPWIQTPPK